ncbi:MAG: HAD-IA family hydrolase [Pseudomonadota bacterium]
MSLDLDDTLWELGPVIRRAEATLHDWLRRHYPAVSERFSSADMFAMRPLMLARYPEHRHDVSTLRRATLRHCFEAVGEPSAGADQAYAVFYAARNEVELFEGASALLEWLSKRFTVLALTNGNADLEQIGLSTHFEHVVTAAKAGASKPERTIFDVALAACGASASQVVHVGDHPSADVEGALGAGMHAVWFNPQGHAWPQDIEVRRRTGQAHHEVRSLAQLRTLLQPAAPRAATTEQSGRG